MMKDIFSCKSLSLSTFAIIGSFVFLTTNADALTCGVDTVSRDGITYGTVVTADGNCWLDRNLGASRVATSGTDTSSYGWYFQWGRGVDGHQYSWSTTTATNSYSDTPGHPHFIKEPNSPNDWRIPQNNNLWQVGTGINNPCPIGFHVPTEDEWTSTISAESINTGEQAFASTLHLSWPGYRRYSDGFMRFAGYYGFHWASTISGTNARILYMTPTGAVNTTASGMSRVSGVPIRCIQDEVIVVTPTITTNSITSITSETATGNGSISDTGGEVPERFIE